MYMPMRVITRKGKKYVYSGDVSNTKICRNSNRQNAKDMGRKIEFVKDPENERIVFMYVSSKFYKSLYRKGEHTFWGKGELVK